MNITLILLDRLIKFLGFLLKVDLTTLKLADFE